MRHSLALLRQELDLAQKELAAIADCSVATVQSIELGRLKLSEKLAARISKKTGVSMIWLLAGEPKRPIPAAETRPGRKIIEFERRHFDAAQAGEKQEWVEADFDVSFRIWQQDLTAILRSAQARGVDDARRCYYRISKTMEAVCEELRKEFGSDEDYRLAAHEKLVRTTVGDPQTGDEVLDFEALPPSDLNRPGHLEKFE
ncbi:MAG: transcriptional regulator with XRE-family HTH domain [Verrucomicrobiales bacterium]|jgi:transcriptional regulator with XRE-family HTH domain